MSESDSFITEVSEEVRRDKLYAVLRKWGWLFALVIVLIVGGTAAVEWRKHLREQAARETGDALRAAVAEADPAARAETLAAIAEEGTAAAIVARFAQAGSLAEAGEIEAAGAVLAGIAADPEASELYRSLARLQRVMVLGDALAVSERFAALDALTMPGSPLRALALEQRAMVRLEDGNDEGAVEDLRAVLEAPGATEAQRNRVNQIIVALGAEVVPEEADTADDAAAEGADAAAPGPADG